VLVHRGLEHVLELVRAEGLRVARQLALGGMGLGLRLRVRPRLRIGARARVGVRVKVESVRVRVHSWGEAPDRA